MDDRQQPLFIL